MRNTPIGGMNGGEMKPLSNMSTKEFKDAICNALDKEDFKKSMSGALIDPDMLGLESSTEKTCNRITMDGVREYCEEMPVEIVISEHTERSVIRAYNEGGFNRVEIDLIDLLNWLKRMCV